MRLSLAVDLHRLISALSAIVSALMLMQRARDHRAIVARIALVSAINMVAPPRVGKRGADDDDLQDCL
jgi:hypothetical protein